MSSNQKGSKINFSQFVRMPNPYLQLYPPPPHPSPPKDKDLSSDPQHLLRFREFYQKHFVANRDFFKFALEPKPFSLWGVESSDFSWWRPPESSQEHNEYGWDQYEKSKGVPYEGNELYDEYVGDYEKENEEENEGKVEFVLSEEAIAMFRFSELRRLKRKIF